MSPKHVPLLALFLLLQGGYETIGGLIFGLSPGGTGTAGDSGATWVALSLVGLGVAAVGVLRMLAGALNLFYRGRRLGMAALVLGLWSCVTCLCLPTSVALCIYGFLVYTSADVRRAFAARGRFDHVPRAEGR